MQKKLGDCMEVYENKQDYAYNALKRLILTCELKPNEKISRKDLAEELHVGNTPIREAILRLEREGLFHTVPQSGTFVTTLNKMKIKESFFIRKNIEKKVFEDFFKIATKQQVKELEKMLVIQRLVFDSNDFEMLFNFDDQFHKFFYKVADMDFTWSWVATVSATLQRGKFLQFEDEESSWHKIQTDHENIVKALKNRDKEKYDQLVSEHLDSLKPDINQILKKHPEYFDK